MNTEDVNCKITKRQLSEEQTKTYSEVQVNVADGGEDVEIKWKAMTIKFIICTTIWSITNTKKEKNLNRMRRCEMKIFIY